MKKIGIIGYGWLGKRLANHFFSDNKILVTSRKKIEGVESIHVDFDKDLSFNESLASCDVIIVTVTYPKETIQVWIQRFKQLLGDFSGQIFLSSTTGIYPSEEGNYTEEELVLKSPWKDLEEGVRVQFPQTTIMRLAGLMGDERYLSKYYLNKTLPDPGARVNHIHYQDICNLIEILIDEKTKGEIYNFAAPQHPKKSEVFFEQTGKITEGKEINRTISGKKLQNKTGYTFVYPDPKSFPFLTN